MKVVVASAKIDEKFSYKANHYHDVWKYFPCECVVCYSAEEVRREVQDADVVLLECCRAIKYKGALHFLNELPVLIGAFYNDVWRGPWWADSSIRTDAHFCVYRTAALRLAHKWNGSFVWVPPRMEVQEYDVPRDIDIVCWGAMTGGLYPMRRYMKQALARCTTSTYEAADLYLTTHNANIHGRTYKYALLHRSGGATYYGPKLWELLCKCKVCATGPVRPSEARGVRAAVGKYFENAACGIVTISNTFDDMEDLGFKHGKNIWITSEERFIEELAYLLEHSDLVQEMSKNAKELIRTKHTPSIRAKELYGYLCERTGKV